MMKSSRPTPKFEKGDRINLKENPYPVPGVVILREVDWTLSEDKESAVWYVQYSVKFPSENGMKYIMEEQLEKSDIKTLVVSQSHIGKYIIAQIVEISKQHNFYQIWLHDKRTEKMIIACEGNTRSICHAFLRGFEMGRCKTFQHMSTGYGI